MLALNTKRNNGNVSLDYSIDWNAVKFTFTVTDAIAGHRWARREYADFETARRDFDALSAELDRLDKAAQTA